MAHRITPEESMRDRIAYNLRKLLAANDITQQELADKIGVSGAAVSAWCSGKKSPRPENIDQICKVLDIDRWDIIKEDEKTREPEQKPLPTDYITIEDIQLAQKIHRLDEYRRKLIESIIATDPGQKEEGR